MSEVLPLPEGPQMAIFSLGGICKRRFDKAGGASDLEVDT